MRKLTILSMISLDGVLQAPGGPEEDRSGGFAHGGWTAPYLDADFGAAMQQELAPADYLLGRKTFDIWEGYWPQHGEFWPAVNSGTKYVLSTTKTESGWENSQFLRTVDDIRALKNTEGRDLQVWGSSELVHLLLQHDLADELRIKIYPLTLGSGKKLFEGTIPASFTLTDSSVTSKGVILANYRRAGGVQTGDVSV